MKKISGKYRKYSSDRFAKYGEDVRSLWGNLDSQLDRFKILSEIGDLRYKDILDVGCGFGGFYGFLMKNFTLAREIPVGGYVGIDISSEIIEVGKKRYPEAHLVCADILNFQPHSFAVDYSIASGIFFLPDPDWTNYMIEVTKKMFALSSIGVAVNFLSTFSPNKDEESHYANPLEVLGVIMHEVSRKVVLRHDYRDNDFTIYIYR